MPTGLEMAMGFRECKRNGNTAGKVANNRNSSSFGSSSRKKRNSVTNSEPEKQQQQQNELKALTATRQQLIHFIFTLLFDCLSNEWFVGWLAAKCGSLLLAGRRTD